MNEPSNPLFEYGFNIPFDRIRAEHVEPAVEYHLEQAAAALSAIKTRSEPLTYAGVLGAYDTATERLEYVMGVVGHLESVANTQALREAYNKVQPKVAEFYANIELDGDLYRVLRDFADSAEGRALTGAKARFLRETLAEFRRHGAELSGADKDRARTLSVELSRTTTQFSQQLLDATADFEILIEDEAGISGLPESARSAARQSAEEKGHTGYRFSLQQPSYVAVLTHADDAGLREQMYRAYYERAVGGTRDNVALVVRILQLRREKAQLLGYQDFADLVLEDRMAKKGAVAQGFVRDLELKTRPFFDAENRALLAFRRELEGESAPELAAWDVSYYAEKLRRARFDLDEEQLRPYFSVDAVLQGMFDVVERIYGVRVEQVEDAAVYHRDVKYYRMADSSGALLGCFYADLYPREGKRGGAWMAPFVTGMEGGEHTTHLGIMCANISPPVGGKPALLTHRDVQTVFHEFGHLLHHLLGRAEVRCLAGTRVAWDFVELPSMIMENFCWSREGLSLFAKHFETGEPIPDQLYERLLKSRTFRAANAQMRQLGFANVDHALHIDLDPTAARPEQVQERARQAMAQFAPTPLPDYFAMIAQFGHLFASPVCYAAGYYSYKWAEVLEADAFSRFEQCGVLSREVGEAFRACVLSRGNEEDPLELYKQFMGRQPRPEALLERSGLVAG